MKLSGKRNRIFLTVDGVRCGVRISAGPWIPQVDPRQVKITCKRLDFPKSFMSAFEVVNGTDSRSDWFENDCIKILPGHPIYNQAKALA